MISFFNRYTSSFKHNNFIYEIDVTVLFGSLNFKQIFNIVRMISSLQGFKEVESYYIKKTKQWK